MSEHFPTPDQFWRTYVEAARAGIPRTWERPFKKPMLTPDEVFESLKQTSELMLRGRDDILLRIYSGGSPQPPHADNHVKASDVSLTAYVDRLESRLDDVGVMVSELQGISRALWLRVASFMASHRQVEHPPVGSALVDLFAGRYRRSFLGLHKDEQDVFTFVIEGRKRFLLWPYATFSRYLEATADAALEPRKLEDLSYEDVRGDAVVLEGGPGDVFFWPAEYWHIAEAVPGAGIASTVSLGLVRNSSPRGLIDSLSRRLYGQATTACPVLSDQLGALGRADSALELSRRRLAAWLHQEQVLASVDATLLAHMSRFGFEVLPEPSPAAELGRDASVRASWPGAVPWTVTAAERLVWSAHGMTMELPAHPALIMVLERLNVARPVNVGQLVDSLPMVGEVAGEPLELDAMLIVQILQRLMQLHVLERVEPA